MKLKLNVYPVIPDMDEKLAEIIQKAVESRAKIVEIAYGKASDSVKKRILNFLNKKDIRSLYSRLEKTDKGWGRIYLHFRWKD
jgi:bifunctional pyridoxal-dependent enzyme with beta-cystathionase and maltose regulon repressor activities